MNRWNQDGLNHDVLNQNDLYHDDWSLNISKNLNFFVESYSEAVLSQKVKVSFTPSRLPSPKCHSQ